MNTEEIIKTGKKAILTEITELQNLEKRIDENFAKAVNLIKNSTGKLIIVGIGKSAHIANKIVATLNSTGTPSQFLHASEAFHGDLGVIQKNDVVLCISNSGNSPEIVAILPFLKKYSHSLIGMSGNPDSKLALSSDIFLNTKVEQEACPNRLAPTSSTTVQVALGDALAVALMEIREFNQSDFAKFHPGGNLGKNLTATVAEFISDQKPVIAKNSKIREIITSISKSRHGITVVAENEQILGVITDGDLRRMLLKDIKIEDVTAENIMSQNPKTIEKDQLAKEAMRILKSNNIGQLVVTENSKYCGIVALHKLLDAGIN